MERLPVFKFNKDKFRIGQLRAFDETVFRIQQKGESHTAIVLPTRYGKSDFMRMTGLHLMHEGAVSGVMIMTPNRYLRNQVVDQDLLRRSFGRYETEVERVNQLGERRKGISPFNMVDRPDIQKMVDSEIVAATTSMVFRNKGTIRHWIDHLKWRYGVHPVVFVDEAHTASNRTAWGQTIAQLAEAHAFIVLCTATPYRTDGQPIPGFKVEPIELENMERRQRVGAHVYTLQGRKMVYRLEAHHVTTFQQAWQESVLCHVSREAFDVDLREHGMDGYEDFMLSGLGEASARRALYAAVRSPTVVREGVRRLVRNLRFRRKDAPDTAAIVFVGSDDGIDLDDDPDDTAANQYANMVRDLIDEESGDREFKVVIATSKVEGDPAQAIEAFAKGQGDVLVVKMMASAGLDIARLKIALDLSTVRTDVSFVQRIMRICTRWDRDGKVAVLWANYITPDDFRGRELYERLIHELGGSSVSIQWDDETGEVIEGEFLPDRWQTPLTTWEATGTQEGEFLADSDGIYAPGSTRPYVDAIFDDRPELSGVIGRARLGDAIDKEARKYANAILMKDQQVANGSPPQADADLPDKDLIDDVQGRSRTLQANIVKRVKQRAANKLRKEYGNKLPKDILGEEIQNSWMWLYRTGGIRWRSGVRPGDMLKSLNEEQLRNLLRILDEEG